MTNYIIAFILIVSVPLGIFIATNYDELQNINTDALRWLPTEVENFFLSEQERSERNQREQDAIQNSNLFDYIDDQLQQERDRQTNNSQYSPTARYQITLFSTIDLATSSSSTAPNINFSAPIAWTSNGARTIFAENSLASTAIRQLAENSSRDQLTRDLQNTGASGGIYHYQTGSVINANATSTLLVRASQQNDQLSLLASVASSSDWFVGVKNFELYTTDGWVASADVSVVLYDAGTRDGSLSSTQYSETDPREQITVLSDIAGYDINDVLRVRIERLVDSQ